MNETSICKPLHFSVYKDRQCYLHDFRSFLCRKRIFSGPHSNSLLSTFVEFLRKVSSLLLPKSEDSKQPHSCFLAFSISTIQFLNLQLPSLFIHRAFFHNCSREAVRKNRCITRLNADVIVRSYSNRNLIEIENFNSRFSENRDI